MPRVKPVIGAVSGMLLGLLFLSAGLWKLTSPLDAAAKMHQALLPQALSLPSAVGFGIAETFAAILLFLPRYRRWGAWLTGLMLVAFLGYFAINYEKLRGADCSCFPWLKRAVGPEFFIGDGVMLLMAVIAGLWARRAEGFKTAASILAAVAMFAGVSFAISESRNSGVKAPDTVLVDGKPYSMQAGKIALYFFDPECMHCNDAAKKMAKLKWSADVKRMGVATRVPQFGKYFTEHTGFDAIITTDLDLLKKTFPFGDPPFLVLIENGRQKAGVSMFDGAEPADSLKKAGFLD